MPYYPPPTHYSGTPHRYLLPINTKLWRIHSQKSDATEFTPHGSARRLYRGRFDGVPTDPYPAYNAGLEPSSFVADILLRGIPVSDKPYRTVRRVRVIGQRATAMRTTVELSVVSLLSTPDLAGVAQDRWLIAADECEYGRVGEWASWIRGKAPWAQGFIWPAGQDSVQQLVVLFGDRCTQSLFNPKPYYQVDLDSANGAAFLNGILVRHGARIMPPHADRG